MISGESPILTTEDREELAAAASNADRRNTPKGFIVIGGIVFVLGFVMLLVSWFSLSGSRLLWDFQSRQIVQIESLAEQLKALEAAANDTSNIQVHPPISSMGSDIIRYADEAGVSVGVPKLSYMNISSTTRTSLFSYPSVTDESLEELLEWVHRAVTEVPGMRVNKMVIRLTATSGTATNSEWKLEVTFARTEHIQ